MLGSLIWWRALGGARFLLKHTSMLSPGSPAERGFASERVAPSARRLPFALPLSPPPLLPPLGPLPRNIISITDSRGAGHLRQVIRSGRADASSGETSVAGGLSGPACLHPSSQGHAAPCTRAASQFLLNPLCAAEACRI